MTAPDTSSSTWRSRPLADAAAILLLVVLASAVNWVYVTRRPDHVYTANFLFSEEGINISLARCLLGGGLIYRDFSIPYGPLPSYAHAGLAALLGNTMQTFVVYCHLASVAFLLLCYAAMRRQAGVALALFVSAVGLIPTMLIPVAPIGGGMFNAYTPFERCVFALAFLAWEPLTRRSAARSIGLGMVLGLAQWVKFGGAFFVGAPIVALDLVVLLGSKADRPTRRARLRSMLATLLGFVVVEGARDLAALLLLPRPVALDVIWPGYAMAAYRAMIEDPMSNEKLYPQYWGWKYFVGQQVNVIAAAVVAMLGLGEGASRLSRALRDPRARRASARLGRALVDFRMLLPFLFYVVGSFRYFGHVYIFMKYYAFLVLATIPFLARRGLRPRLALGLFWLPAWVLIVKFAMFNPIAPEMTKVALPDGQSIWASPQSGPDLEAILDALGLDPARRADPPAPILVTPFASGFGPTYGLEAPPRGAFLIPEYVRPYDLPDLAARFQSARALVIESELAEPDVDDYLARTFDRGLLDILARRQVRRIRINNRRTIILLE